MSKRINHEWVDGVECKWCYKCKDWLFLTHFHKGGCWDGLCNICRKCRKQHVVVTSKKIKQYRKQYYIEHVEEAKQKVKQWANNNPERLKEYKKQYRIDHIEKIKEKDKQYRETHKAKHNANEAKRRTTKHNQTPESANLKEIQFLYDVCAETNELLGEPYFHVDHIQPISKDGLHHEANLQILESTLNMEKNAKWPLSPEEKIKYAGVTFNE